MPCMCMVCHWGRTPAQWLEHYEFLLDKAQQKNGYFILEKLMKPNQPDLVPDPNDMGEDEKEMLPNYLVTPQITANCD